MFGQRPSLGISLQLRAVAIPFALVTVIAVQAVADPIPVDLELVLAVDISRSVDENEAWLQRQGYIRALTDPRLIAAIEGGAAGRIALTYVEWAARGQTHQTVGWRVIGDAKAASEFAELLSGQDIMRGHWTSQSGVIDLAISMLEYNNFAGTRRVIDISGDGPNNVGSNVTLARNRAVEKGITINGLAILSDQGGHLNLADLDVYYRDCVIGGPGAFVVVAQDFDAFAEAILRKLILEIAALEPALPRVILAANHGAAPRPFLQPQKYAPECDIGERLREQYIRRPPPPPGN